MSSKAVVCVVLYNPIVYPDLTNSLQKKKNFVILTIAYVI